MNIIQKILEALARALPQKHPTLPNQVVSKPPRQNRLSTQPILPVESASQESPAPSKWHPPIREDKFIPYKENEFLKYDPETYPTTKHHTGIDYSAKGETEVPIYFCADGEVIESAYLEKSLGNYFCLYVPGVDHTFIYCHLRDTAPIAGQYEMGKVAGITGKTGKSFGIHLHLECIKGQITFSKRMKIYTSETNLLDAVKEGVVKNADDFIRNLL